MKKVLITLIVLAASVTMAQGLLNRGGLRSRLNRPNPGARNQAQPANPNPAPAPAANAGGGASSDTLTDEPGGRSIEFNQTPIDLVFKVYGELVNRTVLKDPQVPSATITLQPRQGQELTDEDKIEAIQTVLEMNGIHMENYGEKFVRALPRKEIRKEGIPLIMDPEQELGESTRFVSLMLPFKNIAIEEAQKALEGFKSASGILLVFERTNSILITDTESNINRMREIARTIDVASPVTEVVEYIQIKNANANEIKQVIDSIVQESQKEQEANGKKINTPAASTASQRPLGNSLLRRPGQNNTPSTPANNESMFMSVSDADRGMIRGKVVTIADERSNKILIISSATNIKFFKQVIEALDVETTPDTVVKVYRLKYAEAEDVSDMINDLIGNSVSSKGSKGNQNQNAKKGSSGSVTRNTQQTAKKSVNQRTGETQAGELSKDNTTVLSDERINGLVVMTNKELVPTIEQIIESMDIKLSQVLIETTIVEVTLGDGIETGMDWVQKGRQKNAKGQVDRSGIMNNYGGATSVGLAGGANGGSQALVAAATNATSVLGQPFTFVFDSDELGLSTILTASKTDSHSKYIASPIVMTLDNKEATVEATASRQFLTGWQAVSSSYAGSGLPSPTYTAKDIGIKLKITPKINPNGTVMLEVEEEYSQVSGSQSMLTPVGSAYQNTQIDVPVTRSMSSDVLMENGQTVVFGGLTERMTKEEETGIPFLKDIPWIGRWLFGSVKENETRTELLVFMTPYVLDDAQAAQAEAIRRKKSMSDSRAWDDNGWSLSNVADPVSQKEQMRRLKEEWKKQDEERQTRIAIEQEKVKRTKMLKEMSKEERYQWLKSHKAELEAEQKKELEKKMLDKNSQDELKKLAERVRADKLAAAEQKLEAAKAETRSENERAKLEAEKEQQKKEPAETK